MDILGVNIGADIGQRVDPTAICVAELQRRDDKEVHYVIRYIERQPLGTPYPEVVEKLTGIHRKLREDGHHPTLYVDATGVGQPVVDLLRAAKLPVQAVYITGGQNETRSAGEIHLAKNLLVSNLQVLLQTKRIHFAHTPETLALVEELLRYELKVTEAGNIQMGAPTGAHDDLATALGLACRPTGARVSFAEFSGGVQLPRGFDPYPRF